MKRIESVANPKVKAAARVLMHPSRELFVVEGKKLLVEALNSKASIHQVFLTEDTAAREESIVTQLPVEPHIVTETVMKRLSSVDTPPGIVAVVGLDNRHHDVRVRTFAALLYAIRDPGNFGTILRSGEAAGGDAVFHTSDCVNPYQAKVVRASMGSIFRIPVIAVAGIATAINDLRGQGMTCYSLDANGEKSLFECELRTPALVVLGSESHGLPRDIMCEQVVSIPMQGRVESLNAAMAATLCFYWIAMRANR